ncbi:hypothetical protein HGM15179_003591 [Zosterops borbonicus]|uniref:Uncharacterized protein n=1 Tax=Zosterops borbonicus TaxID=364589 RepID=A0A8K1GQL7_9PASS|nr:hypothetical protein HGM15179_003591 [Zosterops borbonicus]
MHKVFISTVTQQQSMERRGTRSDEVLMPDPWVEAGYQFRRYLLPIMEETGPRQPVHATPLLIPVSTPDRAEGKPFIPAQTLSNVPPKRDDNGLQKGRKEHGPEFPMCGLCSRQRGSRGSEDLQTPFVLVHLCACEPLLQTALNPLHQDYIYYGRTEERRGEERRGEERRGEERRGEERRGEERRGTGIP